MPTVYSVTALAVAVVYCVWHAWMQSRLRREGTLRRRVAWMLWVMADADDHPAVPGHHFRSTAGDFGYQ